MKILEIVHIRSGTSLEASLRDQIRSSMQGAGSGSAVVTFYRRDGLMDDLAIHILHSDQSDPVEHSDLGLRLAAALSEEALVECTLWKEV